VTGSRSMRILITIALAGGTAGCGPLGPSPAAAGYGLVVAAYWSENARLSIVAFDTYGALESVDIYFFCTGSAHDSCGHGCVAYWPAGWTEANGDLPPKAGRHHGTGGPAERVELSIQCPSPAPWRTDIYVVGSGSPKRRMVSAYFNRYNE
jgi:hypothetical protein